MTAAGWLKEAEDGMWFLYLATPLVDEDGATKDAYRRVNAVIRRMPRPFWIHPLEVKMVAPASPVGKAVQELHGRFPGPSPIRVGSANLGGVAIEGAYVYPPPEPAAR